MRIKKQWLIAAVLGLPWVGSAQTLPDFLNSAAERNLDGKLAREVQVRAQTDFGQAWGGLLPVLTANGGWTHNQFEAVVEIPESATSTKKITITPFDQLDATFKVELPLIDASKWFRTSASALAVDAAAEKTQSTLDSVRRQVVVAFYSHLSARAVLESAQKSATVSSAQFEVTQARAKAGVANDLDLERARAEVERNHQLVADAEALVATSARTLQSLTGLEPTSPPALPSDDLHEERAEAELEQRITGLPQVTAAEKDAATAARTSLAATLALAPTISAQYTQRFTNATGFQNASTLFNAGVNFSWRLDAPAVHALRAQHSAEATAQLNAEKVKQAARDQLNADWQRVRASLIKVRAATAQVRAAQRASSLAHERYAAGVANQIDVIQAERDAFAAEFNEIQAKGELASARAVLKLSAGEAP